MKERIAKRIKEVDVEMQSLKTSLNQHQNIVNDYQKAMTNITDNILRKQGELAGLKKLLEEDNDSDGKTNK